MEDNKRIKKQIASERVKQIYKKKVLEIPEIRKVLNERSKASYRKRKEKEKQDGIIKKVGRPKKPPTEKQTPNQRGRPITIKPLV
jgi:hypothetical protein